MPGSSQRNSGSDSTDSAVIVTPAGSVSPLPAHPNTQQPRSLHTPVPLQDPSSSQAQAASYPQHSYRDSIDSISFDGEHDPTSIEMSSLHPSEKHIRKSSREGRDPHYRNHTRARSTSTSELRSKYTLAAICLLISLLTFVIQTETAVYIQHELHWNKAYCMLWLTHGSWFTLWPMQLLILRLQKQNRSVPFRVFLRQHVNEMREVARIVQHQTLHPPSHTTNSKTGQSPWRYMAKCTAFIATFLTLAGGSWYVAVNLTTPSDLTAIYNCSAFFAYFFSILILSESIRVDKVVSVALAILGVLIVAYGDNLHPKTSSHSGGATNPNFDGDNGGQEGFNPDKRALGNLVIGVGSVMYGLYEVLYKRYACPPDGISPRQGMLFANTFGSMIGTFTLCVLWLPLPVLHYTGLEVFEVPTGKTAGLLAISTLSNAVFSGAFLVLMSLTSPVLSSVAALLTIFLVAIVDWAWTGKVISAAEGWGGGVIVLAFGLLSWATWREMREDGTGKGQGDEKGKYGRVDPGESLIEAGLADDSDDDEGDRVRDEFGRRMEGRRKSSITGE